MATITINDILSFIKNFVGWQEGKKPFHFDVISQHQYRDGLLLRVSRESVTNRLNSSSVSTFIWIPKNKSKPFLYVFLDSLDGLGIRNLSHRIQVFSSERQLTEDTVKVNIHLSESYWLGTHNQANTTVLKLILYCHSRNYDSVDWCWEITGIRKQILTYSFTDYTQDKARDDYRPFLDRFEIRYSSPRSINPILLDKISEIVSPKQTEPPKSRVIELLIFGGFLIGVVWLLVNR